MPLNSPISSNSFLYSTNVPTISKMKKIYQKLKSVSPFRSKNRYRVPIILRVYMQKYRLYVKF